MPVTWRTRVGFAAIAGVVGALGLTAGSATSDYAPPRLTLVASLQLGDRLRPHDKRRLLEAIVRDDRQVTVLLLGQTDRLAEALSRLGGMVHHLDAEVGYVRASIRPSQVSALAALREVDYLSLDGSTRYQDDLESGQTLIGMPPLVSPSDRRDSRRSTAAEPSQPPAHSEPAVPSGPADGRGVTIGIIESVPFLTRPELQEALDAQGRPRPKIARVLLAQDPDRSALGRYHLTGDAIRVRDNAVRVGDRHYTFEGVTPPAGVRVGVLDESRFSYWNGDLDGNGNGGPDKATLTFVWDYAGRRWWVDRNHDARLSLDEMSGAFTDGRGSVSLAASGNTVHPAGTAILALFDAGPDVLSVVPTSVRHGTAVASVAAGNHLRGIGFAPAAPAAAIVPVVTDLNSLSGYVEALIRAARSPDIDLVASQIAGENALNDGANFAGQVAARVAARYRKVLVQSGGNSPAAVATTNDLGAADTVLSIGAWVSADTLARVWNLRISGRGLVPSVNAYGPSADGGLKPDVVAPAGGIVLNGTVGAESSSDVSIPEGYERGLGTSLASPTVAGIVSALLSESRALGWEPEPETIRRTLRATASFEPGIPPYRQGAGVVNLARARALLRTRPSFPEIDVQAPVRTPHAEWLQVPGMGRGLYERDGWALGSSATREIRIRRTTGPSAVQRYRLRLLGETDFAHVSIAEVSLPRDTWVTIPVTLRATRAGALSALLVLDRIDGISGIAHIPILVIVPHELSDASAMREQPTIEPGTSSSIFVSVPEGLPLLRVSLEATSPRLLLRLIDPRGVERGESAYGQRILRLEPAPQAGVWEIVVQNGAFLTGVANAAARLPPAPVSPHITAQAIYNIDPDVVSTSSGSFDLTTAMRRTRAGSLELGGESRSGLSTTHLVNLDVKDDDAWVSFRMTPTGRARGADVDLFSCNDKGCVRRASRVGDAETSRFAFTDRTRGRWVAAVTLPAGLRARMTVLVASRSWGECVPATKWSLSTSSSFERNQSVSDGCAIGVVASSTTGSVGTAQTRALWIGDVDVPSLASH